MTPASRSWVHCIPRYWSKSDTVIGSSPSNDFDELVHLFFGVRDAQNVIYPEQDQTREWIRVPFFVLLLSYVAAWIVPRPGEVEILVVLEELV